MVLEISSFQLDDIETFKPHIAILLNITPDHLDRYEYKMANYVNAKFRVAMNQTSADYFIINGDDPEITNKMQEFAGEQKVVRITEDAYLQGIVSKDASKVFELSIKGRHNLFNAACVVEACRILNIEERGIAAGLKSFVNLPHRLESCGEINGIEFINDSKATNVDSVYYALDAMTKPVIWIAGGTDKGNDYSVLFPLVKNRVKALICLGMDNEKLKSSFKSHIPIIYETTKVSEAVETGLKLGESGDVVLLSPACASFDLFKNYMDRGDQFKACVEGLKISN
jgi:UDP-N-acetylmuramoylalanine--D-glutamate ligase